MNREERRKAGIDKETADKLNQLNQPCTIIEAVKLSQGVADDAIRNYHETLNPVIVSLSLQVEILKDMLFNNASLTEEEFVSRFADRLEEYNQQKTEAISRIQKEVNENKNSPKTDVVAGDMDIKVTN